MGNTIGLSFNNGFAGSYSRQPDQIIDTKKAAGEVPFGAPVFYDPSAPENGVAVADASTVATSFAGIAAREVKTSDMAGAGKYFTNEPAAIMRRGRVAVKCYRGTAALNGDAYVRIAANASYPDCPVGGIEAAADSTNTIKLGSQVKFVGAADVNGIVELEIAYPINA